MIESFFSQKPKAGGFTLIEALVSLLIIGSVSVIASTQIFDSARYSHDQKIKSETEERAIAVLDMISFDVRHLGDGMPLGQDNFNVNSTGLGDAVFPILPTSTPSTLRIRLDKGGRRGWVSSDTSSTSVLAVTLFDAGFVSNGDWIYLSDGLIGGENGLRGQVKSVVSNVVTLKNNYVSGTIPYFVQGSSLYVVRDVVYRDMPDWSGVTYQEDSAPAVVVHPNTRVSFAYLDENGNPVVLPMSQDTIANHLTSIRITVQARSNRMLKDNSQYLVSVSETVVPRYLISSRNVS